MDENSSPPKSRPSPPIPNRTSPTKKPIPLPRFKKRRESLEKNDYSNSDSSDGAQRQSVTQMLKDELKSASDNVQEKGKSVMESTRRIARNMMPKRFTQQDYNGRDNPLMAGSLTDRCQSMPPDDIFRSISFDSPLTPAADAKMNLEESEMKSSSAESPDSPVEYYPPPLYPPPPPPDESLYDEVSSIKSSHSKSSHSGSHQDHGYPSDVDSFQDIDGIYEELSNARSEAAKFNESQDPQGSGFNTFQCSDSETASLPLPLPNKRSKKFLRSDSWTFYDTVSCSQGETSSLDDSGSNIYNEDPVALASASRKTTSSSTSISSQMDALAINSDDLASSRSFSHSSTVDSAGISGSSGSYHSANLFTSPDVMHDSRVEMRKKLTHGPKLPTKSVIYEFDPLYVNIPSAENLTHNGLSENDLMILAGLAPTKEAKVSHYGKININAKDGKKILTIVEEGEAGVASFRPPTPPARSDSMSMISTELTEEDSSEERAIDVPPDVVSVSLSRKSSLSQIDADNSKRFSLLKQHWPSMKRAIKSAVHRDSKVLPTEVES